MTILNILLGAALLLAGRKIFWLFVAGAGFIAGFTIASRLLHGPDWLTLLVGLGIGLLAALVAVFAQHIAFGLAGFLAGGYIATYFLLLLNLERGWLPWLAFVLGGITGILLISALLDWALILLSSLAGASLIVQGFGLHRGLDLLALLLLTGVGIALQTRQLQTEKSASR